MLINWFTVFAQIINFLILVFLLKKFLYRPVLNAIEERESRIAADIKNAEGQKAEAAKERDEFQKKNAAFDQQRIDEWNKAVDEIKIKKQLLLDNVLKESEALHARLQESFIDSQESLSQVIMGKTKEEVYSVARKTLMDLADETLEERMVTVFISQLKNLNAKEIRDMKNTFASASNLVTIKTAFDLTREKQGEIEKEIRKVLGDSARFLFHVCAEMTGGIELNANGFKLEWSISDYLTAAEKNISETIKTRLQIKSSEKKSLKDEF